MSVWDERYGEPGWAFGTEPNDFLREVAPRLPVGRALCLAEGEGRNATYLAGLGHRVTAVDLSQVGLDKLARLAIERGVHVTRVRADLEAFAIEPGAWDTVVAIFAHLPAAARRAMHRRAALGLAKGGAFAAEYYSPAQAQRDTGGPSDPTKLVTLQDLRDELPGLTFEMARALDREILEGRYHNGLASVVQVLARR